MEHTKLITTSVLDNMIMALTTPAHIKDANTGQYINANAPHLTLLGLMSVNELIGRTILDIDIDMKKYWGDNASNIISLEENVKQYKIPMALNKQVWLNKNGFVWVHNTSKIPVIDANGDVYLILTLTNDITKTLSLMNIFELYKHFYSSKKTMIYKFLQHIGIVDYFTELPTEAETLVLIAKKSTTNNKSIANTLNRSLKTVETHLSNLKHKMSNIDKIFNN